MFVSAVPFSERAGNGKVGLGLSRKRRERTKPGMKNAGRDHLGPKLEVDVDIADLVVQVREFDVFCVVDI